MSHTYSYRMLFFLFLIVLISCGENTQDNRLFRLKEDIGIEFSNDLVYTEELNPYTYRNFYNGGGVALGDVNNDGLLDIFFTGNLVDNKLYLNKGNWKFEDITNQAGVASTGSWASGATFADVNGDGLLDLYVCKAGPPGGPNRRNQLYINQGDLTFVDQAKEYGLDLLGLSIHSAFFDFDNDGDLDCYVLNNSIRSVGNFDLIKDQRNIPDSEGNKFYENIDGKFVDVTNEKGIYSSKIGFGLGITLSDFNSDGWTDIFVSNDFFERDYLYINNQGLGFNEVGDDYFQCFSLGSMGADAADLDNDLKTDLFVTEMLPTTLERKKTKAVYENWDKYQSAVKNGYHHQFPRSVLQRNMGKDGFLEVGRFAGVDATEWSWASLIFDMDNDGYKDLFVSNGIYKDLLDRDYLAYMANTEVVKNMMNNKGEVLKKLIDIMPSEAISNVAFKNKGNFQFESKSDDWGFTKASFSNGSAYGDLDNDGDLDLVVSNVNEKAFVYENLCDPESSHFISFDLTGIEKNTKALGAKVMVFYGDKCALLENFTSRGYQSSSTGRMHFGLGPTEIVDSVHVYWNSGKVSQMFSLESNRLYELKESNATSNEIITEQTGKHGFVTLKEHQRFVSDSTTRVFNEFNKDRLLFRMNSSQSPIVRIADVNGDQINDVLIGGGFNQKSYLYLSQPTGEYEVSTKDFLSLERASISDVVFFDADMDGDQDMILGLGGRVSSPFSSDYDDVIMDNNGKGQFIVDQNALDVPKAFSTGAIAYNDKTKLLFLGQRYDVTSYGKPSSGILYQLKDAHNFEKVPMDVFNNLGMITDAEWADLDGDGQSELIIVGEWMPIKIFQKDEDNFIDVTEKFGITSSSGLWNRLKVQDIDNDGDLDLIVGNIGENGVIQPGDRMYVRDFDENGSVEQIICHKIDDKYYPIHDYDDLLSQLAFLKRKFFKYEDYAKADMESLFGTDINKSSTFMDVDLTATTLYINNDGRFDSVELPSEVQYSSTYAIEVMDVNQDGVNDILLGGNHYYVKPQYGPDDASKGWVLIGSLDQSGKYQVNHSEVLGIEGEIRDIIKLNSDEIIISTTKEGVKSYKISYAEK